MAKRRLNLNRVPIPKQPPETRIYNFNEVALGYTEEQAREEARRCLRCKDPGCVSECPISVDIPGFIAAIEEGDFPRAVKILKTENRLPGVTGRVCPKEVQCQHGCILEKKKEGSAVAIGCLERFVADWDLDPGRNAEAGGQTNRQKGCCCRLRPGGSDLRRISGQQGPSGYHLRSAPHSGRRSGLRNS